MTGFHRLRSLEAVEGPLERFDVIGKYVFITVAGFPLRYTRHSSEGRTILRRLHQRDIGRRVIIAKLPNQLRIVWAKEDPLIEIQDRFWDYCCEKFGIPEGVY